jgi:uncharacterized protein YbjT (DUF2867 family)
MKRILLAGATGYLGRYIAELLVEQNYSTKVLVRNSQKFKSFNIQADEIIKAEITEKSTLNSCCKNVDVVISTIGITKQKDGLTYMDVDYQANMNLLNEAIKSGVKKFIYVSVLNGDKLKKLKICEAKEKFVDELKNSGLDYCIICPNGFFSDMAEFLKMAEKGKVYLFGSGNQKANPIHGADLAKVCVSAVESNEKEIEVGGPETITHNEIAELAFKAVRKKTKVVHIPDLLRRLTLKLGKLCMSSKIFGPLDFFMNVMAINMIAPEYGKHTLKNYFSELSK